MLPRSRHHGLRVHQAFVAFHFECSALKVTTRFDGLATELTCEQAVTPGVIAALDRLAARPIDS